MILYEEWSFGFGKLQYFAVKGSRTVPRTDSSPDEIFEVYCTFYSLPFSFHLCCLFMPFITLVSKRE